MVIFITGISSGFGKAMAERLSSEGHKVYGTHRRKIDQSQTDQNGANQNNTDQNNTDQNGTNQGSITYICADSTSVEDVRRAVALVAEREGRIDVFINNAGMGIAGPLEFCSEEDCRRQMDVNFMGLVRYAREVVPIMRSQGGGRIICISSIGGLVGLPFQGMYSASKFALEGYCEALRLEVQAFGISVTTVEPGDFATAFTSRRKSVPSEQATEVYRGYARSLASIEHDETSGLTPDVLAKRISKLISTPRPPFSCIVSTPLQRLAVIAKAVLPSRLFARIMRMYYKV